MNPNTVWRSQGRNCWTKGSFSILYHSWSDFIMEHFRHSLTSSKHNPCWLAADRTLILYCMSQWWIGAIRSSCPTDWACLLGKRAQWPKLTKTSWGIKQKTCSCWSSAASLKGPQRKNSICPNQRVLNNNTTHLPTDVYLEGCQELVLPLCLNPRF